MSLKKSSNSPAAAVVDTSGRLGNWSGTMFNEGIRHWHWRRAGDYTSAFVGFVCARALTCVEEDFGRGEKNFFGPARYGMVPTNPVHSMVLQGEPPPPVANIKTQRA